MEVSDFFSMFKLS